MSDGGEEMEGREGVCVNDSGRGRSGRGGGGIG